MADKDSEEQEVSWSRELVEGYRLQILDFQSQSILRELESIDEYVDYLGFNLPHANDIWKRMNYNAKRQEKYEQQRKRKNP